MKGDFSRESFDPYKHYSAVLMQQGRVQVDADWNEQQEINHHRVATETVDVIGRCGAPLDEAGFEINVDPAEGDLTIGRGRFYVDGILCENDRGTWYFTQPHLPDAPSPRQVLEEAKSNLGLVYLDVWERHVTALDDPRIREVALNGPDTATRKQVIWQVRVMPVTSDDREGPVACDSRFPEWDELLSSMEDMGCLDARTQPEPSSEDPCDIPPTAGYRRLENQLYRVEVHDGGRLGEATFKWSRDNGTVVTAITAPIRGREVLVADLGPDEVLGFGPGQWVELVDDVSELHGVPGDMLQIDTVDPAERVLTMTTAPRAVDLGKRPKLRRWDTTSPSGTLPVDRPSDNDGWTPLEGGVEVTFEPGRFTPGDYWLVPARTATGTIEWPPPALWAARGTARQPAGIRHHYCRLALLAVDPQTRQFVVRDCRPLFPPLAASAMHVVGAKWRNDDLFDSNQFREGLWIELDAEPDRQSVVRGDSVIVTLEAPPNLDVTDPARSPDVSFILDGEVHVEGTVIDWTPLEASLDALKGMVRVATRLRVTLKGHAIWSATTPRLYLDGQAFGVPAMREDGSSPATALMFPTGNGARASDFESWFFVGPPAPLRVERVKFIAYEPDAGERDRGSFPVPAPGPVKVSGDVNIVEVTFTRPVRGAGFGPGARRPSILISRPDEPLRGDVTLDQSALVARFTNDRRQEIPSGTWWMTVAGEPSVGEVVRAADDDTVLDGDYDGQPGGNLVFQFEVMRP